MIRKYPLPLAFLWLAFCLADFSAGAAEVFPLHATNAVARVVEVDGTGLESFFLADDARVAAAFERGLFTLTRTTNAVAAWRSLVQTNDTVGIKVFSQPGPLSGTRPPVVAAIVRGLLVAGLPREQIIIWDKRAGDLRTAGFFSLGEQFGVRVAGAVEAGYDETNFYLPETPITGALLWGDLEFGKKGDGIGKKSFVSKLVSRQLTKIISVAPLLNENDAGICGHFYSLALGSVDNTRRFEGDADRLSLALPEIYALPSVGDHVVLLVTDALLGQYQGGPAVYLQYSAVLDQIWLSHDPVALDTLGLKQLARERKMFEIPPPKENLQTYTNAVLLQLGVSDPVRIQVEKVK
jgi:hypothetical protein